MDKIQKLKSQREDIPLKSSNYKEIIALGIDIKDACYTALDTNLSEKEMYNIVCELIDVVYYERGNMDEAIKILENARNTKPLSDSTYIELTFKMIKIYDEEGYVNRIRDILNSIDKEKFDQEAQQRITDALKKYSKNYLIVVTDQNTTLLVSNDDFMRIENIIENVADEIYNAVGPFFVRWNEVGAERMFYMDETGKHRIIYDQYEDFDPQENHNIYMIEKIRYDTRYKKVRISYKLRF